MKQDLKLFVWEDSLVDYTSGVMFALASDVETARKMLLEAADTPYQIDTVELYLKREPRVIETPKAFLVWGGG